MTEAELIQNLILILAGIFGTAIAGIFVYHYKKKSDCFTVLKNTAYRAEEDISLIKRFLAIQSRMIDDSTKKNHPKDSLELERLAKQMFQEK